MQGRAAAYNAARQRRRCWLLVQRQPAGRELERQAHGCQAALDVLAGRIDRTADKVADAAGVAADAAQAAQAAQDAAGTADKAASVANKAANTAGRAADKAGAPVVVVQPQPQQSKADAHAINQAINQAVQQANTQIKGKNEMGFFSFVNAYRVRGNKPAAIQRPGGF